MEQAAPLKSMEEEPQAAAAAAAATRSQPSTGKLEDTAVAGVGSGVAGAEPTSVAAAGGASNAATADIAKPADASAQQLAEGEKKDNATAVSQSLQMREARISGTVRAVGGGRSGLMFFAFLLCACCCSVRVNQAS